MRTFVDTEFNSYKGQLLSIGLVREDGKALYNVFPFPEEHGIDPWVRANVVPIINSVPRDVPSRHLAIPKFQELLTKFLLDTGTEITIVTDWPDDVKYFSELLITGPGKMIDIPGISFEVVRVDPYTNPLKGAIQHNAMWDALALRYCITGSSEWEPFQPPLQT